MLAGFKRQSGGFEVAVVRRGNANRIDTGMQQGGDGIRTGKALEGGDLADQFFAISLHSRSGPRSDGGQLQFNQAKIAAEDPLAIGRLEHGPIGFVKDHSESDHAGPEAVGLRHEGT